MRYFLNIRTKDRLLVDEEGDVFSDIDQLFEHAKVVVLELERDYPGDRTDEWPVELVALEVADETGAVLFCLPISASSTGSSH